MSSSLFIDSFTGLRPLYALTAPLQQLNANEDYVFTNKSARSEMSLGLWGKKFTVHFLVDEAGKLPSLKLPCQTELLTSPSQAAQHVV
jgi:hypothetical protein